MCQVYSLEEQCVELGRFIPSIPKLNPFLLSLQESCHKLYTAINLIDHFFHDIIDYNMLSKDQKNFEKDERYFDIKTNINELHKVQRDQAKLKNITIQIKFKNFEDGNMIKTDSKRMN